MQQVAISARRLCIIKTLVHRLYNNNITDVAQEVMLHMQHILHGIMASQCFELAPGSHTL